MFEDSTFASTGRIRTRSRAGFVAALFFDSVAVVALVLIPLLSPGILPRTFTSVLLTAPPVTVEEPKPIAASQAHLVPAVLSIGIQAPRQIPPRIYYADKPEPTITIADAADWADPKNAVGTGSPFAAVRPVEVTRAADSRPVRLPSKISEGLLIQRTIPGYPPIARATRTQGTVILQAMISRTGAIENVHVVSGPVMLQQAAMDAVRTWQYRPYLLNGAPIEVETTVNVVFKLE
jgi:periplasmic protein TonB